MKDCLVVISSLKVSVKRMTGIKAVTEIQCRTMYLQTRDEEVDPIKLEAAAG